MSSFERLTPTLRVVVRNPLLDKTYPEKEEILAVIDTGYEGFLVLPRDVFEALGFDSLKLEQKELLLANGQTIRSEAAYGGFSAPGLGISAEGLVETCPGMSEILVGVEALQRARLLLDYCSKRIKVEPCA